jgi:hypothetical protein
MSGIDGTTTSKSESVKSDTVGTNLWNDLLKTGGFSLGYDTRNVDGPAVTLTFFRSEASTYSLNLNHILSGQFGVDPKETNRTLGEDLN